MKFDFSFNIEFTGSEKEKIEKIKKVMKNTTEKTVSFAKEKAKEVKSFLEEDDSFCFECCEECPCKEEDCNNCPYAEDEAACTQEDDGEDNIKCPKEPCDSEYCPCNKENPCPGCAFDTE